MRELADRKLPPLEVDNLVGHSKVAVEIYASESNYWIALLADAACLYISIRDPLVCNF